jgi:hypothetical protein
MLADPTGAGLAPGMYFNLPEDTYHSDPAISRSNIVDLLDTPNTYWSNSWMNPKKKRRPSSDPMEYGSAFHYLLFQPHLFEKLYQVVPIDAWAAEKKKISQEDYFAIVESIKVLRAGADSSLFLSGGQPEVTIVFDDDGMRYRVRIDYLTPVMMTDFKTTWTLNPHHIKKEFDIRGLDVQMALYKRGKKRFKEQFFAGQADVYGTIDAKFFDSFMREEMNEFIFIFQRKTPPHPYIPLMPEDDTEYSGNTKIMRAKEIYQKWWKSHGIKPWPVCEGKVKSFSMFYGMKEEH